MPKLTRRSDNKPKHPKIDLSFSGWFRRVSVTRAMEPESQTFVSTTGMSSEELVAKLKAGKLTISLEDLLEQGSDMEVELFDYEASF